MKLPGRMCYQSLWEHPINCLVAGLNLTTNSTFNNSLQRKNKFDASKPQQLCVFKRTFLVSFVLILVSNTQKELHCPKIKVEREHSVIHHVRINYLVCMKCQQKYFTFPYHFHLPSNCKFTIHIMFLLYI